MHAPPPSAVLRSATAEDCARILECHSAALTELCRSAYADTRLAEWVAGLTPEIYLPAIETDVFIVAEVGTEIAAFAEFDPSDGQIAAVYVHPRYFRQRLGTALYHRVEDEARKADVAELSLLSSLPAVPFYEHLGFAREAPTVMPLDGGIEIPCIPMTKTLTRLPG